MNIFMFFKKNITTYPKIILKLICFMFFLVAGSSTVFAALGDINPPPHNINAFFKMDKASIPAEFKIFDKMFLGESRKGSPGDVNYTGYAKNNSLNCLSRTDPSNGACPTGAYWGNGSTAPLKWGELILRFTEEQTGKTIDLLLYENKIRPPYRDNDVWTSTGNTGEGPVNVDISIQRTELMKLSPGQWKGHLIMNVGKWTNVCTGYATPTVGCPTGLIAKWEANITIKVTDYGTQQIYFSEYSATNPFIDLNLKIAGSNLSTSTAHANKTVDMCLYDGNNSQSSQINLLFIDDGRAATGRAQGMFSVYSDKGGDSIKNRIDYELTLINPLTGAPQKVINGQEIVWSGIGASQGKVKKRLVKLPGVPNLVQCVPVPLTMRVDDFKVSSKIPGRYKGKLSIIYTPTTQSWVDENE